MYKERNKGLGGLEKKIIKKNDVRVDTWSIGKTP